MALDIALLKPAQIGTSEIATKNDISMSLGAYNPATAINSNTTTIDGGKITTNTLQADRLKAGVSGSTVWTGGGLISANFNGNAYGNIGTPTVGFRLSSDAAGTGTDPIYTVHI